MRRILFQLAAGLLFLCPAPAVRSRTAAPALPQTAANSARIASITVTGTDRYQPDQIAAAGKIQVGDVVTAPEIQQAADRLAALGIFSKVNYRFTTKNDEIAIEFQITAAPTYPLLFDNFPWFTDSDIANAIRSEVGLFAGESPGGGAMVDEITDALEKLLMSRNIQGKVTHQLVARPFGDGMLMQFHVDGPVLRVQSVEFDDALARGSERLKDRIPDIQGQPYSRFAIELFEGEQVRPLYASNGFLRAKIGAPVAHLASDSAGPGGSGVDVLISIAPGPVYTWAGVTWRGNAVFSVSNLNAAIDLKAGDAANEMKLGGDWQDIQADYRRIGYLDAKLTPKAQYDDAAHRVSYEVSVVEGPQY
ncbi:MAG: POTRA domain-containing protein, partial [Candidatus Acidiferrales bacterium]